MISSTILLQQLYLWLLLRPGWYTLKNLDSANCVVYMVLDDPSPSGHNQLFVYTYLDQCYKSIESFVSCLALRFIFYYSSLQLMSQFLWTLDAEPQLDITRPAHRHVYCGRCPSSSHDILLAASWRSANNPDSISLSARTFLETIYKLAKPLWSFAPWNSASFKQYVCTRFRISKYKQARNACSTLYYMIKFQAASTAVLQ